MVGSDLTRISGNRVVCGRAVTAQCAGGSVRAIAAAVNALQRGDVLCVVGLGTRACLGDLLASELVRVGAAGVVVDGYVRDRVRLRELGLGVIARGVTPGADHGQGVGRAQVPVAIGETIVSPGDWIVVDDDGVIAVASDRVSEVLVRGEALVARDERILAAIRSGTSLYDAWESQTG